MSQIAQVYRWSMPEIFSVLEAHRQKLLALGVCKLGLFGSYKRGTARPDSDMDFLVMFESSSFDAYMDTKFFLEDLFQCQVDLVLEQNIKPRLRSYILDEVTYSRDCKLYLEDILEVAEKIERYLWNQM